LEHGPSRKWRLVMRYARSGKPNILIASGGIDAIPQRLALEEPVEVAEPQVERDVVVAVGIVAGYVRRDDEIRGFPERRRRRQRLRLHDGQHRARELPALHLRLERRVVPELRARDVDEARAALHPVEPAL